MLRRRLKFLAWLVALLAIVLGGSYLFAPQWLMRAGHLREAMAAKLETHSVQVGDTRWSYYEGGEGPTIVLLHGFAGDKDVWLPVAALLSAHFHLVIPDLPGWGESSRVAQGNYDVDASCWPARAPVRRWPARMPPTSRSAWPAWPCSRRRA